MRYVTDSWIVDSDPGDEDPSSTPVRYAIVEFDFFEWVTSVITE